MNDGGRTTPYVTFMFQSMNQYIIVTVKRWARESLLRNVTDVLSNREVTYEKRQKSETPGLDYGCPAHMLDAIECIKESFQFPSPCAVFKCWKKSGLLSRKHIRDAYTSEKVTFPNQFPPMPVILAENARIANRDVSENTVAPISDAEVEKTMKEFDISTTVREAIDAQNKRARSAHLVSSSVDALGAPKQSVENLDVYVGDWFQSLDFWEKQPSLVCSNGAICS